MGQPHKKNKIKQLKSRTIHTSHTLSLMLVPVSGAGVHIAAVPVSSHLVHLSSVSPAVPVGVLFSAVVPAAELC